MQLTFSKQIYLQLIFIFSLHNSMWPFPRGFRALILYEFIVTPFWSHAHSIAIDAITLKVTVF